MKEKDVLRHISDGAVDRLPDGVANLATGSGGGFGCGCIPDDGNGCGCGSGCGSGCGCGSGDENKKAETVNGSHMYQSVSFQLNDYTIECSGFVAYTAILDYNPKSWRFKEVQMAFTVSYYDSDNHSGRNNDVITLSSYQLNTGGGVTGTTTIPIMLGNTECKIGVTGTLTLERKENGTGDTLEAVSQYSTLTAGTP